MLFKCDLSLLEIGGKKQKTTFHLICFLNSESDCFDYGVDSESIHFLAEAEFIESKQNKKD